ncbi:hypothetical protein K8R33_01245 [archaeon]|nr:hypothetical protein [archaeon]
MVENKTVDERLEELMGMGLQVRRETHRVPDVGELIAIYQGGKEVLNANREYNNISGGGFLKKKIVLLGGLSRSNPDVDLEKLEVDLAKNKIRREHRFIYEDDGTMWTFDFPSREYLKL